MLILVDHHTIEDHCLKCKYKEECSKYFGTGEKIEYQPCYYRDLRIEKPTLEEARRAYRINVYLKCKEGGSTRYDVVEESEYEPPKRYVLIDKFGNSIGTTSTFGGMILLIIVSFLGGGLILMLIGLIISSIF